MTDDDIRLLRIFTEQVERAREGRVVRGTIASQPPAS